MDASRTLDLTLALLGGELVDSTGATLAPVARPLTLITPAAAGRGDLAAALDSGRRVVAAVPLAGSGALARMRAILGVRLAVWRARRRLAAAGATRIRTLAVVPGGETLFLVYELGRPIQPYIEERVLLEPPRIAPHVRLVKRVLGAVGGVPTGVDLVVVVGELA
jgi:hypothetical protein